MNNRWPTKPLGDLVEKGELSYGIVQPGNHVNSGVPIVRVKDLQPGRVDTRAPLRVDPSVSARHQRTVLRGGEVLMSIVGTVGQSAIAASSLAGWNVARAIAVIRPRDIPAKWIELCLQSPEMQAALSSRLNTTVQATLNLADLKSIPIPLPSARERDAIVEVMGALDDKIAASDTARNIARELTRSTFARAARQGVKVAIRDVAQLVTRGITPKYVVSNGAIVLNQKCVRDQRVNLTPSRRTQESSVRLEKLLDRNDVLVNSTGAGTLGRVARWTQDIRATVDSHITIVRFDSTLIDAVCAGFGLLRLEEEIEGLAEGSTGQTELRRDLLAGLEIDVPDKAQQCSIGAELSALDELVLGLQQESDRLAATRDELLPLLMSGKIRVRDAEKVVEGVV